MEPLYIKKENLELGAYIGEDGIIYLRLQGNLTSDNKKELEAWGEKVREAMRIASATDPARTLCLTDITAGLEADEMSSRFVKDLIQHNKEYATRTAVIGANFYMKTILLLALLTTNRTNMKAFDTREEAMQWLLQGE